MRVPTIKNVKKLYNRKVIHRSKFKITYYTIFIFTFRFRIILIIIKYILLYLINNKYDA